MYRENKVLLEYFNDKGTLTLAKVSEKQSSWTFAKSTVKFVILSTNLKGDESVLKSSRSLNVSTKFFNKAVEVLNHKNFSLTK